MGGTFKYGHGSNLTPSILFANYINRTLHNCNVTSVYQFESIEVTVIRINQSILHKLEIINIVEDL